jgi:hypothetical protein
LEPEWVTNLDWLFSFEFMNYDKFTVKEFEASWQKYNREVAGSIDWLACEWLVGASIDWTHRRPNDLWQAIVGLFGRD